MKKKVLFLLVLAMVLTLALASCKDRSVTNLEIIDGTFKYEYELGEVVDLSDLKVKASYSDGAYREITADDLELGTIDTSTVGKKAFTITYDDFTITVEVSVVKELKDDTPEVTLSSIAIDASSVLTKVKVGDTYSTEGITATATYSDGTTKALTAADLTVTAIDTATAGAKTLSATYEGKTAELTVTVLGVKSMQIFGAPASVDMGATLNTAGITALVTFTDDTATTVAAADLTFGALDTATAGAKTLAVSYLDGSASVTITVNPTAILIGISIDATNIGQYINVPDGVELDLAAIKAGVIVRLQYGYELGGAVIREQILSDNSALTVTEVTEGARAVKIAYSGFEKQIAVTESAPVAESISILAGSFVNYVKLGGSFDPDGLMIAVNLSNGTSVQYPLGTSGLELSSIDTATAGDKTLTATYEGLTATATVKVLPVSAITVVGTPDLRVKKGGTLDYSALTFTVIYSDGTGTVTETVAAKDVAVGAIDTASAGNKTFTVTYKGGTGSVSYLVKEVISVALKTPEDGNLDGITKLQVGSAIDESKLAFTVTWSDGTTEVVAMADGVTLSGTEALATAGNHVVTATYLGVSGSFQVNVNEYIIMGVSKPSSLTALENKADGSVSSKVGYFLDHSDTTYVVGDDNPFRFTLNLLALDESDKQITITNYRSASKVYIIEGTTERLLEGDEYALYIDNIDETKNTFDFTQEAVGKTFKIATRPANGILDSQIAAFTRTHTFKVVNAWNIHDVKELNVITNFDHTTGQLNAAHNFLDNNGIARPSGPIAGVVLHNDFHVTTNDIPSEYLIDTGINDAYGNDIYNIYTAFTIFPHNVDYLNTTTGKYEYTMYGNFYTIYSYGVPLVNDTPGRVGAFGQNDGESVSTSHLLLIDTADARSADPATYDNSKYLFNMQNVYLMDDDPNNPTGTAEESARAMRGLIGIKIHHVLADVRNVVIERYYISFFPDFDYVDVTLTKSKLYNAWQNHIFIFGDNIVQKDTNPYDAPIATNHNPTLNIVDCEITVCGGPVIISQTRTLDDNGNPLVCNSKSSPDVNIDSLTRIYTYVQSSAAWFQAFNAVQEAGLIEGINALFMQGYGHSYQVNNPLSGYNGMFMNIIMVNMSNGFSFGGNGGSGVQGSLTIGDTQVMNMESSNFQQAVGTLMMQGIDQNTATQMVLGGMSDVANYNGNLALDALIAGGAAAAPIFQSTAGTAGTATLGSTAYYDGTQLQSPFTGGNLDGLLGTNDGYITLYYAGMGIVLGGFHDHTGPGDGVCK